MIKKQIIRICSNFYGQTNICHSCLESREQGVMFETQAFISLAVHALQCGTGSSGLASIGGGSVDINEDIEVCTRRRRPPTRGEHGGDVWQGGT